jgi:hypothetical protein
MPDTPQLRRHFGLPAVARPGVSYPTAMILGLLDLASGLFVRAAVCPIFTADLRGVLQVHSDLQAGDVLVGDRAFCSFGHIALLRARGVFCCFRLHQSRLRERGRVTWTHGRHRPRWMSKRLLASMPKELSLRIVHHRITQKGYRSKSVWIATTLTDASWNEKRVIDLYRRRWQIETCFAHLKTTMRMGVLKCKSVRGVLIELMGYLIVYNLVRLSMLRWAHLHHTNVWRVSFADTLRFLAAQALGLPGVTTLICNPDRTGRRQLRVRRRRPRHFPWLMQPRTRQPDINPYRRAR